ncbi:JAB domain-containing protein [Sphingomonas oleivorans]|uniref:JAB domain-containing protein n=1 Tax=Sphingomonas oleivorans TaxID=1735121 RepID=UPI0013FE1BB3|nr:DNA repair protein RadC [Sphingomonas oleivorans]
MAGRLIGQFGSLPLLLAASPDALRARIPETPIVDYLMLVRATQLHALRTEMLSGPIVSTSKALIDYLHGSMAHASAEQLRVLYLNSHNRLLRDEVMGHGTVGQAPIYPREIIKRSLELGATALILVHNHPSGDPQPSKDDIQATARVAAVAKALDIVIHDHLIIARSGHASFRALGLL